MEDFNKYIGEYAHYHVVTDTYGCKIIKYFKLPRNIHILVTDDLTYWKYDNKTNSWYQVEKKENKYIQKKYSRGRKNYLTFGYSETYLDPNF